MAAPVWIGVSNQNAIAGQPFEYRMPATDADGDSLSFSFVGTPPAWLSLDVGGGGVTLKGTPPNSLTSYDVTLRADDSRGKTSDVTLRITVADPTTNPSGCINLRQNSSWIFSEARAARSDRDGWNCVIEF